MKRLLAIAFALFAVSTAQAQQKTTSAIKTDITNLFPSSGANLITAVQLRAITNEIADSYANKGGDTFNGNVNVATGSSYQINGTTLLTVSGSNMILGTSGSSQILRSDIADTTGDLFMATGKLGVQTGPTHNAIVGSVKQDGSNGNSFPTGVTGYADLASDGNQAFGLFARADCHSYGVCTNEVNTFNYKSGPPGTFPPNRSFGIANTIPVSLTLAAGGTYQSLAALEIGKEGSVPNNYVAGIYMDPGAITNFGIVVDADASNGATTSASLKNTAATSSNINLLLQMTGAPAAGATFINALNSAGLSVLSVDGAGTITANNPTNARYLVTGVPDGFNGSVNAVGGGDVLLQIGGATKLDVGLTAVTLASGMKIHFTPAALPGTPAEGDCAWDNSIHKLKCYDGTAWQAAW